MRGLPAHAALASALLAATTLFAQPQPSPSPSSTTASSSAATTAPSVSAPPPVRVLTFNILGSDPEMEKSANAQPWPRRKPAVLEILRQSPDGAPYDFIGTQETSVNPDAKLDQVSQLAAAMPDYGSLHAPCRGKSGVVSLTNMLFYKKDRWQLDPVEHGTYWLSDTPETPGSNGWVKELYGDNRGGGRCVTWGLFHETGAQGRTGRKVYFYNTHLNAKVAEARKRSAFLIMERIMQRRHKDAAVIITGDFNSRRDSLVYDYFTGAPVTHNDETRAAPLALLEAFATTNPGATGPRIDFIFVGDPLVPAKSEVIDKDPGGIRPSDHRPVSALLRWTPPAPR